MSTSLYRDAVSVPRPRRSLYKQAQFPLPCLRFFPKKKREIKKKAHRKGEGRETPKRRKETGQKRCAKKRKNREEKRESAISVADIIGINPLARDLES
ncbi:hypothetical protein EJ110_NYTH45541 [Nymphaea thermarum]|nr:hypothetical protein EJ110_NYTH45541 [Nymphaea thermarum]